MSLDKAQWQEKALGLYRQVCDSEWKEQLRRVGQLEAENAGLKNHLAQQEQMLQKAEDKIQTLREEKLFLVQEKTQMLEQLKQFQ